MAGNATEHDHAVGNELQHSHVIKKAMCYAFNINFRDNQVQ